MFWFLGGHMWSQESCFMIPVDLFQLRIFYDSGVTYEIMGSDLTVTIPEYNFRIIIILGCDRNLSAHLQRSRERQESQNEDYHNKEDQHPSQGQQKGSAREMRNGRTMPVWIHLLLTEQQHGTNVSFWFLNAYVADKSKEQMRHGCVESSCIPTYIAEGPAPLTL